MDTTDVGVVDALTHARNTLAREDATDAEIARAASGLQRHRDHPEVAAFIERLKAART